MQRVRRKWKAGRSLDRTAQVVAVASCPLIPIIHLAAQRRLSTVVGFAQRLAGNTNAPARGSKPTKRAREIGVGVNLAAGLWGLGDRSCIARSLVTWTICQRMGYQTEVWVGVALDESPEASRQAVSPLLGHAWVEIDGFVVDDLPDVRQRYAAFDKPLLDRHGVYVGASAPV